MGDVKGMTDDEVDRFFNAIPPDKVRDRLAFKLMLSLGLRIGEVVGGSYPHITKGGERVITVLPGVHFKDINWKEKKLSVCGKGTKVRTLAISDESILKDVETIVGLKDENVLIIRTFNGKQMSDHNLRKLFHEYAKKAGIYRVPPDKISPHALRHTFAFRFLRDGGDLMVLRKILGHVDIGTTQIYVEMTDDDACERSRKILNKSGNKNCLTCKGNKLIPVITEDGKRIIINCPDCNK